MDWRAPIIDNKKAAQRRLSCAMEPATGLEPVTPALRVRELNLYPDSANFTEFKITARKYMYIANIELAIRTRFPTNFTLIDA